MLLLRQLNVGLVLYGCLVVMLGCGSNSAPLPETIASKSLNPLSDMKAAVRGQVWDEAWLFVDEVEQRYPDDPEALVLVAQVAHMNKHPERSADLLLRACRAESLANERRIQQAMIALVAVGRLYDGIDLLADAVREHPDQWESRRWFYDFCIGTEDRPSAVEHGRMLVRSRHFDLELLQTLGNIERRNQDIAPLTTMVERNPSDWRPKLGEARTLFDESRFDSAIKIINDVLERHPNHAPAERMLARILSRTERTDELQAWLARQPESMKQFADYWLVLGHWAEKQSQRRPAARAYWEATRRDPDIMESWSKLGAQLRTLVNDDPVLSKVIPADSLQAINQRVSRLSSINQSQNRFERTGNISRVIALEIVNTLADVGRLWEAEAWAAIAQTLPEDNTVPVAEVRQTIVRRLTPDTPWQITEGLAEFQLDLTAFDIPIPSHSLDAHEPTTQPFQSDQKDLGKWRLENKASAYGLNFFARTSERLNTPGIMLFQTLGCGGGSLDFDLDGRVDLYLVTAGGAPPNIDSEPNALMRQLDDKFVDVAGASEVNDRGFGQGVAIGDCNEDGFPDLVILNYGPKRLYINQGDGTFADASASLRFEDSTIAHEGWATCGAIADLDGDGISDIVIVNYCAGLDAVTVTCPMAGSTVSRSCTPVKFPALRDQFFQGMGQGTFQEKTSQWNANPEIPGRGLGIIVGDLDGTPGLETFVANDMTNNHLWKPIIESGKFTLSESAMPRGLAGDDRLLAQGSMGIASGDFDRDRDIDLYVTNFDNEYNTYHEQTHAGVWQDRTNKLGLVAPTMLMVGFGTQAVDMDNDGLVELVVSNGHVDLFSRDDEHAAYAQPMQIFHRLPDGIYESRERLVAGEYAQGIHVGRALWTSDINRDGRMDLLVTHQTESVAMLLNESEPAGHYLQLQLVGRSVSRDAIGATVTVQAENDSWLQTLVAGDGYLCSNERLLHFGLGKHTSDMRVEVTWSDGQSQVIESVPINRRVLVVQGDEAPFPFED